MEFCLLFLPEVGFGYSRNWFKGKSTGSHGISTPPKRYHTGRLWVSRQED